MIKKHNFDLSVLLVCRRFLQEIAPLFYGDGKFILSRGNFCVQDFLDQIGPSNSSYIRNLLYEIDYDTLITDHVGPLRTLRSQAPSLKRLVILYSPAFDFDFVFNDDTGEANEEVKCLRSFLEEQIKSRQDFFDEHTRLLQEFFDELYLLEQSTHVTFKGRDRFSDLALNRSNEARNNVA
jgi:hypothetical protein